MTRINRWNGILLFFALVLSYQCTPDVPESERPVAEMPVASSIGKSNISRLLIEEPLTIELHSNTAKNKIYYTLDGTEPVPEENGLWYKKKGITIDASTVVKAITTQKNMQTSDVAVIEFLHHSFVENLYFERPNSPKYPANSTWTLIDEKRAKVSYTDENWLGFEVDDFGVTFDFGEMQVVRSVETGFLQQHKYWIFLPTAISYAVSDDGKTFRTLKTQRYPTDEKGKDRVVNMQEQFIDLTTRYFRIHAENIAICPEWHVGKGGKAWLFVDEVVIR
ncbi:MAG: chitobiase/beta-hexosaminidase C-terminal domain-containing protein [Chitinophagales bacterium]